MIPAATPSSATMIALAPRQVVLARAAPAGPSDGWLVLESTAAGGPTIRTLYSAIRQVGPIIGSARTHTVSIAAAFLRTPPGRAVSPGGVPILPGTREARAEDPREPAPTGGQKRLRPADCTRRRHPLRTPPSRQAPPVPGSSASPRCSPPRFLPEVYFRCTATGSPGLAAT